MNSVDLDKYEYESLYGKYPDTQQENVEYLVNILRYDPAKLVEEENKINSLEWIEKEFTIYLVPKGTPRPRYSSSTGSFYVKDAKKNKKLFKEYISDMGIICTRTEIILKTYLPTPISSMTNIEVILAEKGLIRPISTPDFDNLAKTYTDALQDLLLLNDNIINPGCVEKYYSVKPRINILLKYQNNFDCNYNRKKTEGSISYRKLIEGDKNNA